MRLFTGISIPAEVLASLEAVLAELRPAAAELNWSPAGNLHITTKFIGEWPEARLGNLEQALSAVKGKVFEVEIERFGFFPTPHRPHTFFAGVKGGDELNRLATETERVVVALGGAAETREFTPHLTMAKIRNREFAGLQKAIARMGVRSFGTFAVNSFHLYLSESVAGASVYRTLATYSIEGAE